MEEPDELEMATDGAAGDWAMCPSCGSALVLRRPRSRTAHYAHKAGESCRLAGARLRRTTAGWTVGGGEDDPDSLESLLDLVDDDGPEPPRPPARPRTTPEGRLF